MTAPVFFYVPCRDDAEAKKLARLMIEKKLAGCANLFPITSIYPWEGKVEEAEEVALVLKTMPTHADVLEAAIKAAHSYKIPCIARLKTEGVNSEFANWLTRQLI